MTIKEFVDDVLCVPVTRIGNKYIIEAIELVVDTRNHKFYETLANITHQSVRCLETAIRQAKILGLSYMKATDKLAIFGETACPENTTYILRAAEYYRRNYEN